MQGGRIRLETGRRRLLGWGSAYPGPAVTSAALCARMEEVFGLKAIRRGRIIAAKLGVETRHVCRDFEQAHEMPRATARNPELAALAMQHALNRAGLAPNSLSYLISHTATPAMLLPGGSAEIACLIRHTGAHMELRQACTGFANALQVAFAMTQTPGAAPIGIVGVETGSVYFDPQSLHTLPEQWVNLLQMGDGAAAVVIGPDEVGASGPFLTSAFFGQCQHAPETGLCLKAGGSDAASVSAGTLHFEHRYDGIRKHGLALIELGREALRSQNFDVQDAAWVVPHQASGALAPWLARTWQLPVDRVCAHAASVGNLGSASIWAALDHLMSRRDTWQGNTALFLGAEATQYSYGGFALELA